MEADLFQEIFDVLESRQNRLHVNIRHGSPITKILLSSFDYMTGPELKFKWEPRYAEPFLLLDEHTDDSQSDRITSSSKQTNDDLQLQYDESEFLASAYECGEPENHPNLMCVSSTSWLGQQTQPSASTLRSSSYDNTTITLNNEQKECFDNKTDDEHSSYTSVSGTEAENADEMENGQNNADEQVKNTAMITSCVDSGITGTISMHSDLSNCRSPKPTSSNSALQHQPIDELNSCSDSDYGYCADDTNQNESGQEGGSDDSENLIDCVEKHATASFLNASSNVVGLSMLGASMDYSENLSMTTESKALQQLRTNSPKVGDYQALSDDEFVAKFVLAEQICSIQFDSNPIVPKISVIPNRQLMICSYLFSAKDDVKTMMALSVVMNENSEEWFYGREKMFEEMFIDIITRLKASLIAEQEADQICRLTTDFIELFNLLGTLERYPLLDATNSWKVDNKKFSEIQKMCNVFLINPQVPAFTPSFQLTKTDLMNDYLDKQDLRFLYKSISGCLMCQGCTVVFGNNTELVDKLLLTLSLFVHSSQRPLCLKAHSFHYSPYIKLQGLKRAETEELYMTASDSHWPVCFIDLDRKWVSTSGNYFTHHSRKEALQLYSISQIFKDANSDLLDDSANSTRRPPIISPIPLEVDPYVCNMLDAFFLLSAEQSERLAFIQHFQMNLDYKAKALVQTVKELSEPANNFKENFVSCKWSLTSAKKLLNLRVETTFLLVVARADLLTSLFAQFLFCRPSL